MKRLHPLVAERIANGEDPFSIDLEVGTGKTTIRALNLLVSALTDPGVTMHPGGNFNFHGRVNIVNLAVRLAEKMELRHIHPVNKESLIFECRKGNSK